MRKRVFIVDEYGVYWKRWWVNGVVESKCE